VNDSVDGIVINLNAYGATVRLENGDLASASPADVEAHRADYQHSHNARHELAFELRREGRRPVVVLAPQIHDDELDEQIASYLKSTQEWDAPDGLPQAERHFLRKKRRASLFVSKHQT
jgi:hypothetical protein